LRAVSRFAEAPVIEEGSKIACAPKSDGLVCKWFKLHHQFEKPASRGLFYVSDRCGGTAFT
jgi:hypothetical protein